jgi:hypothetical protein
MLQEHSQWLHYINNIIAADVYSAVFLGSYMRHMRIYKTDAAYMEVFDLQKYQVLNKEQKVRQAIKERSKIPFVFVVGKN